MDSDKQMRHILGLAKRRQISPASIKASEAAISDALRVKREAEAKKAANLWKKGYDAEGRK